jgi:hypothetical protein
MEDPALNIGNELSGIGFIPAAIELLGRDTKLDHQIAG